MVERRKPGTLKIAGGLLVVLIALIALTTLANNRGYSNADREAAASASASDQAVAQAFAAQQAADEAKAAAAAAAAAQAARVPSGYKDWGNGIAWRYSTDQENAKASCGYTRCTWVIVYAYENCSSVYVEANMVDSNGNALGITNDLLGHLSAGDGGVATLRVIYSNAVGVRLTEITCG